MEHYGTLYSLNFHSLLLARKQWPRPGEGRVHCSHAALQHFYLTVVTRRTIAHIIHQLARFISQYSHTQIKYWETKMKKYGYRLHECGCGAFESELDWTRELLSSRPAAVVVVSVARCDEPCFLPSGAPTFPWEAGLRNWTTNTITNYIIKVVTTARWSA